MKRPVVRMWVWGFLATVGCGWVSGAWAFQLETHRVVNERAVVVSTLDAHLKEELGLRGGILEVFNSIRVQDWIGIGGRAEDLFREDEVGGALYRSKHHFQNPLLSWDRAGLTGRCILPVTGQASVRWAQSEQDQTGGSARWADARRLFLTSLALPSKGERDTAAADLFKILGQQMHLVADLAAPAHVRNDIHCTSHSESFEVWAERKENRDSLGTVQPIRPDPGIFNVGLPIQDQIARVPVARLWDTEAYRVTQNPDLTLNGLAGLAEYTNANFFSKNTIFSPAFPFPARTSVDLDPVAQIDPKTGKLRRYFTKVRDGQLLNRVAVPGALYDSLPEALKDKNIGLDDSVLAEYATHLFPRAVGYSAAVLDYFFRGKLDAMIGADPVDSEKLQLTAKNASFEPLDRGTLSVYGDYASGERRPLGSWPVQGPVAPGGDLPSQSFSPASPIPARYMVVYQGDLGEEKKDNPPGFGGAVIGKAAKYGGVLEELILFRTPNNTYDVYFRNANQVVLLGLSENLPVPLSRTGVGPAEVHWGVDSNHFFVKNYEIRTVAGIEIGVPVYWIYKIDRPDNSVSGDEPVQVALVKTIRPPETPLPYGYRETWVNREEWNNGGQMVYPYGMVFTPPYVHVQEAPSEQEVLSEDLGNGTGLEIYALFQARVYEGILYLDGGSGQGDLGVSLIIQASTGAIVYEDPISGSYKAQAAAAVSRGHDAAAWFSAWPRTRIVSWSDKDVKKRRWVTQLQADDFYTTWDDEVGTTNYFVENSVQTVLIEDGQPKFSITPKRPYVEIVYERAWARFYPAALVPTMSSEKWLWVDEPDMFTPPDQEGKGDADILRRTQYLMSTETGTKQRVGEWTPPDSTQFMMAPKIREMVMLRPGFLYAHGDPVYAIPVLSGYERSPFLLAQDLTSDAEKQKFVSFLSPGGQIDPAFTTSAPVVEDADLRGKGRVKTDIYPPEFQAVLDTLLNPGSNTKISWHVVPDPDLVPARRR
jgi:hypothetical protein